MTCLDGRVVGLVLLVEETTPELFLPRLRFIASFIWIDRNYLVVIFSTFLLIKKISTLASTQKVTEKGKESTTLMAFTEIPNVERLSIYLLCGCVCSVTLICWASHIRPARA